jgi:4-hydroxythreonine-4-phosphate dehydrogenase
MGDPAGIGPELCLRALRARPVARSGVPVIFGDAGVLRRVAAVTGLAFTAEVVPLAEFRPRSIPGPAVVDCGVVKAAEVRPGRVSAACGRAAARYIREAVGAALAGRVAAVATAPIHKQALHRAGFTFPGHTEFLAALTGAKRSCMMMASSELIVSLATIHVALERVKGLLTRRGILEVILLTADALRRLGRRVPSIAVCGLNPHAGEHGIFGDEERRIIAPAIAEARAKGLRVEGPLPPDTAFLPPKRRAVDAYVAMYHDQGLIPFKLLAFERGVNITLGLPIVRTSVDHGTAFDIAWQGKASAASLIESIRWAARLAGAGPG